MAKEARITEALQILLDLGLPRAQQNDRSAYCLLSLLNITPRKPWAEADSPLMGITPMMDFAREHYHKHYAPNTRETFRRQTIHQFEQAGIVIYNPDEPGRPVNSPKAVYKITPEVLEIIRHYGTPEYQQLLAGFLSHTSTLAERYANERTQQLVSVKLREGTEITLSPGGHSALIKNIIEDFAPRFLPGAALVYVGDTGEKWGYFDQKLLLSLGVAVDSHGKMPDVVLYSDEKRWLVLVESVTSHGPVDPKRHRELADLFANAQATLVFVTAFPTRSTMVRHLNDISWETEVWIADAPSHMIHFNGDKFLGPHSGK